MGIGQRLAWMGAGISAVFVAAGSSPIRSSEDRIPGFSASGSGEQRRIEERIAAMLDSSVIGRHFRYLTEEPHPAGSERNRELAEYVRDRFADYGLEDIEILRYDVLLPLPREVAVKMEEPFEYEALLKEDGYPVDKDSYASEVGPTYLSMSASGDVTAPVIYAHSGNPDDYEWLESQGIEPAGKIALVRYSVPYSYRGFKAWEAQRRGVKALLVYSDPMEDGFVKGDVFPDGPWGPESHIQRGAISYDFIVPGDPLTPGWASLEGAKRIPQEEAQSIPGIIAVPLSWRDARPILENLGGPVAPSAWQGGLPFTYHVGPGTTVRVKVDMDDAVRPIYVTVGSIRGTEEPARMVVLGNHRDAWVYGAVDPSSGTATQIELARILGNLGREGHRPRRTIVLASWDAEEVHLTGSTEWGEQFAQKLKEGAIAYLNVDSATSGPDFDASGVASLNASVISVSKDVIDPNTRRTLFEAWQRQRESAGRPSAETDLVANELGSGSDYTVFLNFLGIPIANLSFEGPHGVYHSQYDNHYWMTHFGDPGFRYMAAMAEVWGRLALRLANADVFPYDFVGYAQTIDGFLDSLQSQTEVKDHLDFGEVRAALESWEAEARALQAVIDRRLATDGATLDERRAWNAALIGIERELLLDEGIPNRSWFKHALYAPRYTYAPMMLPGVQEAVDAGDLPRARQQLARLTERFQSVARRLKGVVALAH